MQLGRIIPIVNRYPRFPQRQHNASHPLETGKGIFYEGRNLFGNKEPEFYLNLIYLFDSAILQNNLHVLSIEQQALLEEYFKEGNSITPDPQVDINTFQYNFSVLSKHIKRLDEFLGSFFGEDDGRFAKYGTEQLRKERKLTSS